MDGKQSISEEISPANGRTRPYGTDSHIVDFILGITFEIWEQRQIDSILQYYAEDVEVFSLEGITRGAASMVESTHETLAAYPDRLLLGDEVIYAGSTSKGFSSHRLISPMTHLGTSNFGPATGRDVRVMNVADCEINQGFITREWLVRDNLALVNQLNIDVLPAAQSLADKFDAPLIDWLRQEFEDTINSNPPHNYSDEADPVAYFARRVLESCWITGDATTLAAAYAPYCHLYRAPVRIMSGNRRILEHYAEWRQAFPGARLRIDHVCSQQINDDSSADCRNIAVRWSIAGKHEGKFAGRDATGRPVYILGVTHWKVIDGRIATEWTVFDELAMLAQTIRETI